MPETTPTLTDEQREEFVQTLAGHFVMWHEIDRGARALPVGEWRCACGMKFGSSNSAIDHQADALAPIIARMVADAEQRGRIEGSRAEAALWRQQIEDRDRSGIMALDRQLAEEEGYERGRAEVSVAVEAVCRGLERPLNGARQRATSGEDFAAIRGEEASARSHAQQVRAALTDPAAAVARIKAEALREAADGELERCTGDWNGETCDDCRASARRLRDRADRIGGDA